MWKYNRNGRWQLNDLIVCNWIEKWRKTKNRKLEKKAITVVSHFTVFPTVVLWNPQMWSFLWFSLSHVFWLIRKPSWNLTWFWLGTVGQRLLTWPHGDSGYPSFWKREPTALADLSPPGMQGWDSLYSQLRQFLQMFHMFSKWMCVPYLWNAIFGV